MASHFEFERERLHKLVDGFIDAVEEQWDEDDMPRLDSPVIAGFIEYRDPDADPSETNPTIVSMPFWYSETKRKHIVMGTFDACSLVIQGKFMYAGAESDSDEDDTSGD